ncbi:MAG: peptidase T [Enterocloster asparagiformis]|nr:peptidase T [Enterocloster asparagiformis]
MNSLVERFLRYVAIDTQSRPGTGTFPSTEKQKDLGNLLVRELHQMGVSDAAMDEYGTVYASIPSNSGEGIPAIGFTAHMDTAPDLPGCNVKPRIIENYDGTDIVLNEEQNIIFSVEQFPRLKVYQGKDLIVGDGTTLLGADDKSGVAVIMEMARRLTEDPQIRHGDVKLCFTCDEEIGNSTKHFDLEKFNCDFAYSMDGGELGEFYYDNFNCGIVQVTVKGRVAHTGYAWHRLVNSMEVAMELHSLLDPLAVPAGTRDREGFTHLAEIKGDVGTTQMRYLVRDHELSLFEKKKDDLRRIAGFLNDKYGQGTVELAFEDVMYNMRDKILKTPFIIENAVKCMEELGIEPVIIPVRGGVDGAEITFKGLPCPNLFTGGDNCHTIYEYTCIQSMEKSYELLVKLCESCLSIQRERK